MVDERLQVVVVDLVEDVEALRRGADLPGVEERGPGAAPGRHVDLVGDVGADDERVLAAHLQVDPGDPLRADGGDPLAGLDRAGERDALDPLVGHQRRADRAVAGDDVHDPGGEVVEARGDREGRQRRELRGLRHGRVAGGERRGQLPRQQQQRVVPRHDAGHRPDRVLDHQRELAGLDRRDHATGGVPADLGVVVERRRGPADLVGVLDQRLAALEGHQLGELVGARAHARGDLVQQLGALDRGRALPAALGLGGGRDRGIELLVRRRSDGRDGLLRVRVLDRDLGARAGHALASDRKPGLDLAHPDKATVGFRAG